MILPSPDSLDNDLAHKFLSGSPFEPPPAPQDALSYGTAPRANKASRILIELHTRPSPLTEGTSGCGEVPLLFQTRPLLQSPRRRKGVVDRSPTRSYQTRWGWSKKEFEILCASERELGPVPYWATVQFTEVLGVPALQDWHYYFARGVGRHNRGGSSPVGLYFTREVGADNTVHLHVLLRTGHPEPEPLLGWLVGRACGGVAAVTYFGAVRESRAVCAYAVKHVWGAKWGWYRGRRGRKKPLLLFRPKLGIDQVGEVGGYFARPKRELWRECIDKWYFDEGRCPGPDPTTAPRLAR